MALAVGSLRVGKRVGGIGICIVIALVGIVEQHKLSVAVTKSPNGAETSNLLGAAWSGTSRQGATRIRNTPSFQRLQRTLAEEGVRRKPTPGARSASDASIALSVQLAASGLVLAFIFGTRSVRAFEDSPWFSAVSKQQFSSRTTSLPPTATQRDSKIYIPPVGLPLPYPSINDNTEGAAAFRDILELLPEPLPGHSELLLLDVGGGRSDAGKRFLQTAKPRCRVVVADPYNRSETENAATQHAIEDAGGADVATSMSVLNVIQESQVRADHIGLLHRALRPGGIALFKVWPGLWPERGTGRPAADPTQDSFQANAWASAFLPEVEAVFGPGRAYADNNLNLVVAAHAP